MKTIATLRRIAVIALLALGLPFGPLAHGAGGQDYKTPEMTALLSALPNSKLTLAEGLKHKALRAETPISAKFELDDNKKLSLSVYTAEKGLRIEPEHNVLKEVSGSPEQARWAPETEVFKDPEHVARASEHLVLSALSVRSVLDVVMDAAKQRKGIVFSIAPALRERKPMFVVLVAENGRVLELLYDIPTGKLLQRP